jgi:tetratricopeptide (TPR) repeat protein
VHLKTALDDPEYAVQPRFATITYLNYGCALLELDRLDEAAAAARRAVELGNEANDLVSVSMAAHLLCEVTLNSGDLAGAVSLSHQTVALATQAGDPLSEALAHDLRASCLAAAGDLPAAMEAWQQALAIFRSLRHVFQQPLEQWLSELAVSAETLKRDSQRRAAARRMT